MKKQNTVFILTVVLTLFLSVATNSQIDSLITSKLDSLLKYNQSLEHRLDVLQKNIDDVLWFERVGDPVKFWSYVFIPKDIDYNKKYPLIVFPHGGVHADFTTYHTHIIKELMYQQYIVVAADYRGSTGYGKSHFEKIDYGGREIDDVDS
nr:S9 family peptidase [Ignavibacteriaceae bacterium]